MDIYHAVMEYEKILEGDIMQTEFKKLCEKAVDDYFLLNYNQEEYQVSRMQFVTGGGVPDTQLPFIP